MEQQPVTSNPQPGYTPDPIQEEEETLNLGDFFALCLSKWGWFAISIACFLALGAFYLMSTPKSYTRSASLIIKDNQSGSMSTVNDMMSTMGIFNSSPDVNNEMLAFQSPELFAEVIRKLDDNVIYNTRRFLRPVLLYGDSLPVKVNFIGLTDRQNGGLRVRILGKGQVELSKFKDTFGKKISADPMTVNLGDTVMTPIGKIAVNPGPNFNPEFDKSITVSHMSINSAIEYFKKKVSVSIVSDDATVIEISMNDVSVSRADDFIDTLIEAYNAKWIDDKDQLAALTSKFISDRLMVIEHELGNVDSDISKFKSEHLLPDVQAAAEIYMQRSDENLRRELEITTQISIADYLRDFASATLEKGGLMPANSGIESSGIERQISEYNTLQLERDGLLSNSSPSNPIIQDYDSRLRSMRTAIISSLNNLVVTLQTQLKTIKKADRSTNEAIASSPSQAKYLLSVERQQKVKEALYLFLLQKREENELSRSFTPFNTRIINLATGSNIPTSPKTLNILIICFFLGIIIPAVILFLNETFNTKLRSREDLKKMQTPFVGEIPHSDIKKYFSLGERFRRMTSRLTGHTYREDRVPSIVVKPQSLNIINEAFRMLRANLEFMTTGKEHKVIMVTSFNPGSGKSFVTINLAAAMAVKLKEGRVLAIDLDLRRATLSDIIPGSRQGITDYLAGTVNDYTKLIRESSCPGLDVLPVGKIPPNPTELLYSDRLTSLIESLREKYDYIFIDCPPAEIVADASIITKLSDMTLFVVRAGLLDKRDIPGIDDFYNSKRYKNLAVVLNGTYIHNSPYRRYGSYAANSDYYDKE